MSVGKNSQELIKYTFGINSIAVSTIFMKVTACNGLHCWTVAKPTNYFPNILGLVKVNYFYFTILPSISDQVFRYEDQLKKISFFYLKN